MQAIENEKYNNNSEKNGSRPTLYVLYCVRVGHIIVTLVNAILVQASCAVRAYWSQLPTVRSGFVIGVADYFVGIKCSSVITLLQVQSSAIISLTGFICTGITN